MTETNPSFFCLSFFFSVQQTKGPHWDVPTGRRDGRRSVKQDALDNLPPPFFDAGRNLYQFFIPKGLDAKDQVVLLGNTLLNGHILDSMLIVNK
jgi:hypothetical protein